MIGRRSTVLHPVGGDLKTQTDRRISKFKRLLLVGLASAVMFVAFATSVCALDDPVSTALRSRTEAILNAQVVRWYQKSKSDQLSPLDRATLHAATLAGVVATWASAPEAGAILYHYVYGDGSPLELSPDYFQQSNYLRSRIKALGPGRHGPIALAQRRDWRLSLALNPYYLDVDEDHVRIFHPRIQFAAITAPPVRTVVPIGKLRIRVYDNLVSALNPEPFAVFAEWETSR